jgi:hypothetical protein
VLEIIGGLPSGTHACRPAIRPTSADITLARSIKMGTKNCPEELAKNHELVQLDQYGTIPPTDAGY